MKKKELYKELFEVSSKEEQDAKWRELNAKGYHGSEIYCFNYQGADGKFHREIFVFAR